MKLNYTEIQSMRKFAINVNYSLSSIEEDINRIDALWRLYSAQNVIETYPLQDVQHQYQKYSTDIAQFHVYLVNMYSKLHALEVSIAVGNKKAINPFFSAVSKQLLESISKTRRLENKIHKKLELLK